MVPQPTTVRLEDLAEVVEGLGALCIGVSTAGTITSWPPAAEAFYGLPSTETVGQPWSRFIPEDARRIETKRLDHVVETGRPAHWESKRLGAEGRTSIVLVTILPVRDPCGDVSALAVIERDLTWRRAAEAELRQAKRSEVLGRLTTGVAQEFNNIQTVILALLDFIRPSIPADGPARQDVDALSEQAQRGSRLARRLLAFGTRKSAEPLPIAIDALLRDLEPLLQQLIGEQTSLILDLASEDATILADEGTLQMMLVDVVLAATTTVGNAGAVIVSTRDPRVAPDGNAVASAALPAGQFITLVATAHELIDGERPDGLRPPPLPDEAGLPEMRVTLLSAAVRELGGYLVAASPQHGLGVAVYLPIARSAAPAPMTTARPPQAMPAEVILVVEDELSVRAVICRTLRDQGYSVLEATNGIEALSVVESHAAPIDLVITDVIMPGMDGRILSELLRQLYQSLRILFISGYARGVLTDMEFEGAGTAFLAKPFEMRALIDEVHRLLESHGMMEVPVAAPPVGSSGSDAAASA